MKARLLARRAAWLGAALVAVFVTAMAVIAADGLNDELGPCDVAIVLGSKVNPDGAPSARLRARLERAAQLYRRGLFERIIVSGGLGKEGYDEAAVMKGYLVDKGIPESVVLSDSAGDNTLATARNAAALMKAQGLSSAMAITQYFHVPRTRLALQAQGVHPVYTAHASFFEMRDLYSLPREVVGYLAYWLKTR